jgi:hypothetical protein
MRISCAIWGVMFSTSDRFLGNNPDRRRPRPVPLMLQRDFAGVVVAIGDYEQNLFALLAVVLGVINRQADCVAHGSAALGVDSIEHRSSCLMLLVNESRYGTSLKSTMNTPS